MQHLAGPRAGRDDRVIPALVGVPVAGALLLIAIDLTDKAVDVNDHPGVARAGTSRPRPANALREDSVELTDMSERERAQKRP